MRLHSCVRYYLLHRFAAVHYMPISEEMLQDRVLDHGENDADHFSVLQWINQESFSKKLLSAGSKPFEVFARSKWKLWIENESLSDALEGDERFDCSDDDRIILLKDWCKDAAQFLKTGEIGATATD